MTIRGNRTKTALNKAQRARLKQIIQQSFNDREFRRLCLDLGISIHQLTGNTHAEHIQALIDELIRQNRLYRLLDYLQDKKPKSDIWHNVMRVPMMSDVPKRQSNGRLLLLIVLLAVLGSVLFIPYVLQQDANTALFPTLTVEPAATLLLVNITPTVTSTPESTTTAITPTDPKPNSSATSTTVILEQTAVLPTLTYTPPPASVTSTPTTIITPTVEAIVQAIMLQTVNVRQGPGTNYPVVQIITGGEQIPVVAQHEARNGLWYIVMLSDGTNGWVSSRVSQLNDEAAREFLPPVSTVPTVPLDSSARTTPIAPSIPNETDPDGSLRATPGT